MCSEVTRRIVEREKWRHFSKQNFLLDEVLLYDKSLLDQEHGSLNEGINRPRATVAASTLLITATYLDQNVHPTERFIALILFLLFPFSFSFFSSSQKTWVSESRRESSTEPKTPVSQCSVLVRRKKGTKVHLRRFTGQNCPSGRGKWVSKSSQTRPVVVIGWFRGKSVPVWFTGPYSDQQKKKRLNNQVVKLNVLNW